MEADQVQPRPGHRRRLPAIALQRRRQDVRGAVTGRAVACRRRLGSSRASRAGRADVHPRLVVRRKTQPLPADAPPEEQIGCGQAHATARIARYRRDSRAPWRRPDHFVRIGAIKMRVNSWDIALSVSLAIVLAGCASVAPSAGTVAKPNWVSVGKVRELDVSSLVRSGDIVTYRSRDAHIFFANFKVVANCSTLERQELENTAVPGMEGQMRQTFPDTEHRKEVEAACRSAAK